MATVAAFLTNVIGSPAIMEIDKTPFGMNPYFRFKPYPAKSKAERPGESIEDPMSKMQKDARRKLRMDEVFFIGL